MAMMEKKYLGCLSNLEGTVGSGPAAEAICAQIHGDEAPPEIDLGEVSGSLDTTFVLFCAFLVFWMQAGFAMLSAGSIRAKNTKNILIKNMLDACVGAIAFYLFGYGFAYGTTDGLKPNAFIGAGLFALYKYTDWTAWLFQWAFSAATATIVSGSVAERTKFEAYLMYSAFLTAFAYPVVVHWVWDENGWLSAFNADPLAGIGMIDFAGSGVVHMVGGFAGLMGAYFVGPRIGRFPPKDAAPGTPGSPITGHSATLVVLGTFILWLGWYGFNPGSMLAISGAETAEVVGRVAVTTTLSAASAGLTTLVIHKLTSGDWDLIQVCNGVLGGLVSITAGCPVLEPWAAIIAGFVGAFVLYGASNLLVKLRIDDPLDAAPVHGFCGIWGVLVVGFLAKKEYVMQAYGSDAHFGAFYPGGGGKLLACQLAGIVSIIAWTCALLGTFFFILSKLGHLRVSPEEEEDGLDYSHHGGGAYESYAQQMGDARTKTFADRDRARVKSPKSALNGNGDA